MDFKTQLDDVDEELGCVRRRWIETDGIDHSLMEDYNRKSSSDDRCGPELLTTIRSVVNFVRSNYSAEPFCDAF